MRTADIIHMKLVAGRHATGGSKKYTQAKCVYSVQ